MKYTSGLTLVHVKTNMSLSLQLPHSLPLSLCLFLSHTHTEENSKKARSTVKPQAPMVTSGEY